MENIMTLSQETKYNGQRFGIFSGLKTKTIYKIRIMSGKVYNKHIIIIVT